MSRVLVEAAATAPARPGVYYFVGEEGELLYVGKAADVRKRLVGHARADPRRGHGFRLQSLYPLVRDVRWEEAPSEEAALAREVDVIVVLRPRFNASLADDGRWVHVVVDAREGGARLEVVRDPPRVTRARRVFGCFPHLGVGVASKTGIACSEGYASLVRLLWVAGGVTTERVMPFPRKISGPSPPATADVFLDEPERGALHDLLAGRSRRLLDSLAPAVEDDLVEPYLRPALRRDLLGAEEFFRAGPRALRDFRRRAGLPTGLVSRETFERVIREEVAAVLQH